MLEEEVEEDDTMDNRPRIDYRDMRSWDVGDEKGRNNTRFGSTQQEQMRERCEIRFCDSAFTCYMNVMSLMTCECTNMWPPTLKVLNDAG